MIKAIVLLFVSYLFLFFRMQDRRMELSSHVSLSAFIEEPYTRIKLTEADLTLADSLTSLYVRTNYSAYAWTRRIEHVEDYYRQYAGFAHRANERIVFINAFKRPHHVGRAFMEENLILYKGGGSDFFSIKVDLNKKQCYDLKVNAPK